MDSGLGIITTCLICRSGPLLPISLAYVVDNN